jgi:hypothetical protein
MAASIAGVNWRAVRFIRECRREAVSFGSLEGVFPGQGVFPGRYPQENGIGGRLWRIVNLGGHFFGYRGVSHVPGLWAVSYVLQVLKFSSKI